jgi:hypothetical protein
VTAPPSVAASLPYGHCPECSRVNGFIVRHSGPPCAPGAAAFDPRNKEYEEMLKAVEDEEYKEMLKEGDKYS